MLKICGKVLRRTKITDLLSQKLSFCLKQDYNVFTKNIFNAKIYNYERSKREKMVTVHSAVFRIN